MAGIEGAAAGQMCSEGDGPSWRQLNRRLWVGHDGTSTIGTIEQGSRYVYIDAEGAARRSFHTLHEAQSAATGAIELPVLHAPMGPRQRRLAMFVHGAVLLTGAAALVAAAWTIGWVLFVR